MAVLVGRHSCLVPGCHPLQLPFLKSDGKFSVGLHMASASFLTQQSGNHYPSIRIGTKDGTYLLLRQ